MIRHQQIYKPGPFGGTLNTTICGRMNSACKDGMNVGGKVTCKLCLKRMQQAKQRKVPQ